MEIVTVDTFPWRWWRKLGYQKRKAGNPGSRQKYRYKDIVTAFDIETSRLPDIEQSVMYIWQWCFGDRCVCIGRTWDELLELLRGLELWLKPGDRVFVGVHNLSYEFQFLRGIWKFSPEDVFCTGPRKILRAMMGEHFELRCTYLHSNMSLAEYTSKMEVEHIKLSGEDFGYDKVRYPWTHLTEEELDYATYDAIGLVEAVTKEMEVDGDNLYTFPLTSTGYVRRDVKRIMKQVSYTYIHSQYPAFDIYEMLREAFRGGDTHANRYFVGQIVNEGSSADRSSSYPEVICNCRFPVSAFFRDPKKRHYTLDDVVDLIEVKEKAVIMRVSLSNLHPRDPQWPAPYLSRDKCRNIIGATYDNGRILEAEYLETTITDVDLRIILREYAAEWYFFDLAYARYGPLPDPLVRLVCEYYLRKTELKNVEGQEIYYTKAKIKTNSIYGLMAQDPVKELIRFTEEGVMDEYGQIDYYPTDTGKTKKTLLEEHEKTAFLCYQWGCWVTAWARYRLRQGIWLAIEQGAEPLYWDTDSLKYLGVIDWSGYNNDRIRESLKSGAYADDPDGVTHYMGVFEREADFVEFRTLGAKKYCYTYRKKGKLVTVVTVAGVGKAAGAEELVAAGGVEAFKSGFTFVKAGGLEAVYNDRPAIDHVEIDGHLLQITTNVVLRPSTYTLGVSADFARLLHMRVDDWQF